MTLSEIIQAINEGKKVFWKSSYYPLVDTPDGIMIQSLFRGHASYGFNLPLSWAYDTKDFEPETFYSKGVSC